MNRLAGLSRTGRLVLAVCVGGALFGVATAVQASIPDSSGVVHACYVTPGKLSSTTPRWGTLRAIDVAKGQTCAPDETPIDLASTSLTQMSETTWSGWIYPFQARPQPDGHVATFTFTSPLAGYAVVDASIGVRVKDDGTNDCHVQSQLAAAPAVLPNVQPGTTGMPGYTDNWINGNLPTESGAGTYLTVNQSTSRVFPVVAGTNTIYLDGAYTGYTSGIDDCVDALWGPISITATLVQSDSTPALSAP